VEDHEALSPLGLLFLDIRSVLDMVFIDNIHAHYGHGSGPLGFTLVQADALTSVGGFLALAIVFFILQLCDKTNKRGLTVFVAQLCYLLVSTVTHEVPPSVGKWYRRGLCTTINASAIGYRPVHNRTVEIPASEVSVLPCG
jgi:hypothetical protein